jgi:hypothetical protein
MNTNKLDEEISGRLKIVRDHERFVSMPGEMDLEKSKSDIDEENEANDEENETNNQSTGIGVDIYYGGPKESQPNWRTDDDPDAGIDDNDDPSPIDPKLLSQILGFDPDEEVYGAEPENDEDENEDEDEDMGVERSNPYHEPSGPKGGQFAKGPSGSGSSGEDETAHHIKELTDWLDSHKPNEFNKQQIADRQKQLEYWKSKTKSSDKKSEPESKQEEKKQEVKPIEKKSATWKPGDAPIDLKLPIGERIKQAKHLDEKVKAMAAIPGKQKELWKAYDDAQENTKKYIQEIAKPDKELTEDQKKRIKELNKTSSDALEASNRYEKEARQIVAKAIQLPRGTKEIDWTHHTGLLEAPQKDPVKHAMDFMVGKIAGNAMLPLRWRPIPLASEQRAFADQSNHSINLEHFTNTATAIHEWGHHIEFSVPWVRAAAIEFLKHRVGNEQPRKLVEVEPTSNYKSSEIGCKDEFDKAFDVGHAYYIGKAYKSGDTEIVSMGMQKLCEDPVHFASKDPEYFKFMLGILDGSLRKG